MVDFDKVVKKNRDDEFNSELGDILSQIDLYKQQSITDYNYLLLLNERVNALYVKLFGYLNDEEIKEQTIFRNKINSINIFDIRKSMYDGEIIKQKIPNSQRCSIYKILLEKREIHLNIIMRNVGLSPRTKRKDTRVV